MSRTDQGYAIFDHVFEHNDMTSVLMALDTASVSRTKAGARHILSVPIVRELANDSRLESIASQFIGPPAVPFRATLFDKSHTANWLVVRHQDTVLPLCRCVDASDWGPWSVKAGVLYARAPADLPSPVSSSQAAVPTRGSFCHGLGIGVVQNLQRGKHTSFDLADVQRMSRWHANGNNDER